ncbi:hypothetical protein AiwAL_11035 [Acidiphilium sp. AL]|uniref:Uncharacterized protein n=1 Tax=Acidiphilium iwatense TaxID=768198 RepID=A0ABS9DWV1_9PROT|nr:MULTISPECIES: hypothetical protein [Acidiphilium]MCF3947154.1 hypothetical protein [Acidiphilium iwatense]MCU4160637.1 hypothetical protein [Acidiphilium sp. AL]
MAGNPLTWNDMITIYGWLSALAKQEQKTRSAGRMVLDSGKSVLAALHIPIEPEKQTLSAQILDLKQFYNAVQASQPVLNTLPSPTFNVCKLINDKNTETLMKLVSYAFRHLPSTDHKYQQIERYLLNRNWFVQDIDSFGTWAPDPKWTQDKLIHGYGGLHG